MKKQLLIIFLIFALTLLSITGCTNDDTTEAIDNPVVNDGVVKVGLLLELADAESNSSELIRMGFDYGHSLADSLNIGNTVSVETIFAQYTNDTDALNACEELSSSNVSAVVTDGNNTDALSVISEFFASRNIPVISIKSTSCQSNALFSLGINYEYVSSAASTYAMEKSYSRCAVLADDDSDYFKNYSDKFSATLKSYTGYTPTVYYKNGESTNFTAAAFNGGSYDFVFVLCSDNSRGDVVKELRTCGYNGDIMLTEVFDKSSVNNADYNGCTFVSKLEADSNNNISTVFYSMFAEYSNISAQEVSAASAYGYDAYMVIFEALKSFAGGSDSSLIFNSTPTETSESSENDEILGSDLIKALKEIRYYGVTDTISFVNNSSVPTYIYVDNISDAEIINSGKYNFSSQSQNN